jgi:hypothetical protein
MSEHNAVVKGEGAKGHPSNITKGAMDRNRKT